MKKLISSIIIMSLLMTVAFTSFADTSKQLASNEVYYPIAKAKQISQEELQHRAAIQASNRALDRYMAYSDVSVRTPTYEYKHVLVKSREYRRKPIGYAGGQKANGTVFTSPGGFYWQDGGNEVDLSFSIGYGVFYVGVAAGKATTTGKWISSPYVNEYCKLFIYKDIKIKAYKLYRKPMMVPNAPWEYDRTYHTKTETGDILHVDNAPYNL